MSTEDRDTDREAAIALLSEEERAAIAEDELSPEDKAAMEKLAGDEGDDDDDDDDAGGQGAAAAEAKPEEKPSEPVVAAEEKPAEEAKDDEEVFRPRYHIDVPEDLDAQLAAAADAELALIDKFKAGEIEADELLAEQRQIAAKRDGLLDVKRKAETFELLNRQDAEQEWAFEVRSFMRGVKKAEGIDYKANPELQSDFDTFVRLVAQKPKNKDKGYDFFLEQAHERVKALHKLGKPPVQKDEAPKDDKAAVKAAVDKRKPNAAAAPKTLATVPGGEGPGDIAGDEYEDIDKLDGLAYETALAKMTPEQRERYLST